jgi:16S rRNA (cytosine967-C5)-methyltransferase
MPAPGPKHTIISCRGVALQVLLTVERQQVFADEAFDKGSTTHKLSKEDRALAFELTQKPLRGLPTVIVMILRLGAYQLLHLDRVPESAAVNESVKLARRVKGRDWSGVVNGVLRNLIRQAEPQKPDASEAPTQALSIQYSCPAWITQRWIDRLGFEGAERVCQHTIGIPPLTIRTNILRSSREELQEWFEKEGQVVAQSAVSPVGLTVEKCGALHALKPLQEGWCYVEDEAAQLVPLLLDVQPGQRVLDACAAPGGKTTHMAELMKDQGEIVAVDRSAKRLEALKENTERLGLSCIKPIVGTWSEDMPPTSSIASILEIGFDRILVDAPCSGLGVLRRHPEAKWQKAKEPFRDHQALQQKILNRVSTYLRRGGVLVYSACSVEPEETTHVISRFCLDHPEFQLESSAPFLPPGSQSLVGPDGNLLTLGSAYDMDGFFAARLRKA